MHQERICILGGCIKGGMTVINPACCAANSDLISRLFPCRYGPDGFPALLYRCALWRILARPWREDVARDTTFQQHLGRFSSLDPQLHVGVLEVVIGSSI